MVWAGRKSKAKESMRSCGLVGSVRKNVDNEKACPSTFDDKTHPFRC